MKVRLAILAALGIYVLALVGVALAPRAAQGESTPTTQPSAATSPPAQLMLGFALNLHHTDNIDAYLQAVDEISALGFNTVELLTPMFQANGASESMRIVVGPGKSPARKDIVKVLKYARAKGLTTVLMPMVLFENPRGNEWRGKIQPEHWDRWWAAYQKNIDYFLDIANESDVSVFSVGSELLSTEKQLDRWETLIAQARHRFKGRLSYSTNWDHYQKPTFWKHLDMIGISCYWDMTRGAKENPPSDQSLALRWEGVRKEVLAFAEAQGKPVFFTEIGYPSLPWGLKDPWNYVASDSEKSDAAVQARGYQAFLAAWDDLLRTSPNPQRFTGVCFYKWDVYMSGGPTDTGYGIRGKPAYDLVKRWLQTRLAQAPAVPHTP
ncbi:MAG: hypothetical protein IT444_11100 [Phycisphaeraceae bacterium]|nr:hypothetical protein [Phycisphaeraceae bacterium]